MTNKELTLAQLMRAMIKYDGGDAPRIQHFVKVHDFARMIAIAPVFPTIILRLLMNPLSLLACIFLRSSSNSCFHALKALRALKMALKSPQLRFRTNVSKAAR